MPRLSSAWPRKSKLKKLDILCRLLPGSQNDFHWQLGGNNNQQRQKSFWLPGSRPRRTSNFFSFDFRAHAEGSPCIKVSLLMSLMQEPNNFSLVILWSTTSEKLFIFCNLSAPVQAIKVCPNCPKSGCGLPLVWIYWGMVVDNAT